MLMLGRNVNDGLVNVFDSKAHRGIANYLSQIVQTQCVGFHLIPRQLSLMPAIERPVRASLCLLNAPLYIFYITRKYLKAIQSRKNVRNMQQPVNHLTALAFSGKTLFVSIWKFDKLFLPINVWGKEAVASGKEMLENRFENLALSRGAKSSGTGGIQSGGPVKEIFTRCYLWFRYNGGLTKNWLVSKADIGKGLCETELGNGANYENSN